MKNQKNRSMKVYSQNGRNYKATPTIILKGQWLEEMGFTIGDYISVSCENGKLVITPDTERAEMEQMKANNRRKVFGDAVDLLMDDIEEKTAAGGLRMLSIKKIRPFHDHPFHLYEGDRLEDMVASVREPGTVSADSGQIVEVGTVGGDGSGSAYYYCRNDR